ncbi:unnamed protein product, partial [marine sediment metagenome]
MTPTDWIQAISMLILVVVTVVYAWRTHVISKATKKQAEASVKMAEEMREQRVIASRPIVVQKAVVETETELAAFGSKDWFSYFEVYNVGNGAAIEIEISLLNKDKTPIHSRRKSFLGINESPIEFCPSELVGLEKTTYYLVCEYRSIISHTLKPPTWYQTWLPFETVEASAKGKIYVKPGELKFEEVNEKERIDAFSSRS